MEEDYLKLSLEDRLTHKVWKARSSAYTELHDLFKRTANDSDFIQYEGCLKTIATDANAVAQETGLNAIYQYVDKAPNPSSSCESVVAALVQKCLGAPRTGTKQKATDIIMLYAEVGMAEPTVNLVLSGLDAKQPKLVAQTVMVLRELLRQFGAQAVNPKPLVKVLGKLFAHADKNVRAEAFKLTTELYRWIGPALSPSLSSVKPVQMKELEEAFEKLPSDRPTPERLLRSEQQIKSEIIAMDVEIGKSGHNTSEPMEEVHLDPFDLADPIDITAKLPDNFYELLESKKWQERREALDSLLKSTKTPKIMDNDYTELIKALTKRINDANILLVGVTANCIEGITSGLRTNFGKYKGLVAPPLIEKLKERKPAVLEQVANALHAVFSVVPIMDMTEDLSVGVTHKNPQIRTQSIMLITRQLQTIRRIPSKQEATALAQLMLKTLDDADGTAREVSAEGLGYLMKVVGEKMMRAYIDALDDIKKNKIMEYYGKAETKAIASVTKKHAPSAPKAPVMVQRKVLESSKPVTSKLESMVIDDAPTFATTAIPSKRKLASKLFGESQSKKPTLSTNRLKPTTGTKPITDAPAKTNALSPTSGTEEVKYKFSPEDAEARVNQYIPLQLWNDIGSGQWKVRLAAMEALLHLFGSTLRPTDIEAEIIIRCLAKKPGWKEMNFQVMTKLYDIMQLLASTCPSFSRSCVCIGIPGLVEKLGDIKLKKPAAECLVAFAERTSLQFVLSQGYPIWKKAKSPKIMTDALIWIHQALLDFGIVGLQVRDLMDFTKAALSNTNPTVRSKAVTLLGALRMYTGPEIATFVQDVTPALLATIESEFEKVSKSDPPLPTKTSAPGPSLPGKGNRIATGSQDPTRANALDSMIPRTDISHQLGQVASDCNDPSWKKRKEGLDRVVSIIEGANKRIKANLGDFPSVLKQRLHDSNKILQIQAIEITGLLVISVGKPFEKFVKSLSSDITSVLSDNKATVRNAGVATLEIIRQTCGLEGLIGTFGASLATDSPVLRKELLSWLSITINEQDQAGMTVDYSPLISPLLSCLQDRNVEVRKAAQNFLPLLMMATGIDTVLHKVWELTDTQQKTVAPFVETARGSALSLLSSKTVGTAAPKIERLSSALTSSASASASASSVSSSYTANQPDATSAIGSERKKLLAPRSTVTEIATSPSPSADDTSVAVLKAHPPILTSDLRAKLFRGKKEPRWQLGVPQPNMVAALHGACEPHFHSDVCKLMFSSGHQAERDHISALDRLCEGIIGSDTSMDKYGLGHSDMKRRYLANSDLIFKYLTIRFNDTNTSILIKSLHLAQQLVDAFDSESATFSEYEAISFIPFLINKAGDPKETIRTRIRSILRKICAIYPASKMVNFLLDASTNSKNAKTRIECLDEVGSLIQEYGISVMLPTKALPLIASHIGDRDASVRHASLNAIAQAYALIGDPVFKYVGRLNEVEKGMLEERLKRTKPSPLAATEKENGPQQSLLLDKMDIDDPQPIEKFINRQSSFAISPSPSSTIPTHHNNRNATPRELAETMSDRTLSIHESRSPHPTESAKPASIYQTQPTRLHDFSSSSSSHHQQQKAHQAHSNQQIITQISNGDTRSIIEALKLLEKSLRTEPELVLPSIEPLIGAITYQIRLSYSTVDPLHPVTTRLCKHLVNALVLLFSNTKLAGAVSEKSIHDLLQELPHPLFDQNILALESGPQLSKALNVAMLKILENSPRNATFSALLSILASCSAGLQPGDSSAGKETMYTELIMKCIWKLAKTIQGTLKSGVLCPDELLFQINKFFSVTPPTEWKQRLKDNVPLGELPLRTVKTILLELVNGLGEEIFGHLGLINDPEHSGVYPYIVHMLESSKKKRELQPRSSYHHSHSSSTMTSASTNSTNHPSLSSSGTHSQHERQHTSPNSKSTSQHLGIPTHRSSSHNLSSESAASSREQLDSIHSTMIDRSARSSSPANTRYSQPQPVRVDNGLTKPPSHNEIPLSEAQMTEILKNIFEKIGIKEESKEGIIELYEFQKRYPLAANKVDVYLNETGSYFQRYIRRGLDNLAADDHRPV